MPFSRRGFLQVAVGSGAASALLPDVARAAGIEAGAADLDEVAIKFTINGEKRAATVHPDMSALELVRERIGLTGTKEGCGHGACGACTLHLDGAPVVSCLLPATAADGRELRTVEGLGSALHPVQRAFMAEDALQCGYCTPGFIVESVTFYDRWRAEHGAVAPDREVIAAALAGHLCRCGAYASIFRAVARACAGDFDGAEPEGGPPSARVDGREKVTGVARYTVDVQLDGQLEGVILRSPHASAIVREIDTSAALQMPGVSGWVRLIGESGRVRYAGQEIGALAATSRRAAHEALRAVRVTYEVQTPVIGMSAAMAPGAPLVYGEGTRGAPSSAEGPSTPAKWTGNVRGPTRTDAFLKKKDARQNLDALKAGAPGHMVQAVYETAVQCHTALEPHAAVARWKGKALEVWVSTQAILALKEDLAHRYRLAPDQIAVYAPYVGGGFGAKAVLSHETLAAIELARATGAPVRVALGRAEELTVGGHRPAERIDLTLGADGQGALVGLSMKSWTDAGCAVGAALGLFARVMYPDAEKELFDYDVVWNGPPGTAFRGPFGAPAFFALEQAIDTLAQARGEDPITLRRRWDPQPLRGRLFDWASRIPEWKDRGAVGADKGRYRRGVGLATSSWPCFVQPNSRVRIEAGGGRLLVSTGTSDMGNGSRTVLATTVAERLGLPITDVEVRIGDSRDEPGPMAAGSRSTSSLYPTALDACEELIGELVAVAKRAFGLQEGELRPEGWLSGGKITTWATLLDKAPPITVVGKRRRDVGGYFLPVSLMDTNVSKALTSAVQVAEVEVDSRLGKVRVTRFWSGIGCGKVVVPKVAMSQAMGAIIQGVGYALYEERRIDPTTGRLLSAGLEDYRIPGIGDTPEMTVHFDEGGFEDVRGRAVGMAELATVGVSATLGNALHHATGWRPTSTPFRVDRVLQGLRA